MATSPGGIEVSRISVRAVPDTSRLFEELKADLAAIERRVSIDVKASVDAARLTESARTAVAEAQALAGDIDIRTNVDTSQLSEVSSVLRHAGTGATGLLGSFTALGAGAAVLSTALIPLTAVVAGLAAALVAPLAIAVGGVTVFGFLAGFAAKDTLKQIKQIDTLKAKLGTLQKGTTDYTTTLGQLRAAQAAMSPAQAAFAKALQGVKSAFDALPKSALLKPLTDSMQLLANILPTLAPIIRTVSKVFDGLIGQMNKTVSSPGFKGFIEAFAKRLGPDLRAFARIAANVFVGLVGLFGTLNDSLSKGVLGGLVAVSDKFAEFGRSAKSNEGLRSFADYVRTNLPLVGRIAGGVFTVIAKAIGTLAPVGHGVLVALDGIVSALGSLGAAAGPLGASLAALGIGSFFGGPEVGAAAAAVVGLVGAFGTLYQHSKPLQGIIHDLGDYFQRTFLPVIKQASGEIMPAFRSAIGDISKSIRDNKGLFETLGKAIVALASLTVIGAIVALAGAIRGIGKAFQFGVTVVKFFANVTIIAFQAIVDAVGFIVKAVDTVFGVIVDGAAAAFGWIPGIGDNVKAAQGAFHRFADTAEGNIAGVGDSLKRLRDQINGVGNSHPQLRIDSNTLQQIAYMHELQQLQIQDKHFKITATIEQQIERTTGPGGGIQRPTGTSGSGSGGSGALVNIERANFVDTNDVIRKAGRRFRARAGGGVLFPPALVPAGG